MEPRFEPVWLHVICYFPEPSKCEMLYVVLSLLNICHFQHLHLFRFPHDCKLPAGRGSGLLPSQLLSAWRSLLSLRKTLSHRSWQVGRALVVSLLEPEMQAPCSQACFVCFSFRKSNCHAVCWQLFLPLRTPQPAGDQAHGGTLHSLSQRQHPPYCQPGAQSECWPGAPFLQARGWGGVLAVTL